MADDKLMLSRLLLICLTTADSATFPRSAISCNASQNSFSNDTLVLRPFVKIERLITADFMTPACKCPDSRIKTIMPLRWTIAITSYLHQPVDAIVVGWETAPSISLAIAAAESRVRSLRDQIAHCYEEPVDSVGALHMHLAVAFTS